MREQAHFQFRDEWWLLSRQGQGDRTEPTMVDMHCRYARHSPRPAPAPDPRSKWRKNPHEPTRTVQVTNKKEQQPSGHHSRHASLIRGDACVALSEAEQLLTSVCGALQIRALSGLNCSFLPRPSDGTHSNVMVLCCAVLCKLLALEAALQ